MKVSEITSYLESVAPLSLQESYDNSGLQVGPFDLDVSGILISLDVTEEVIEDALKKECNMIVAHHPLIFEGLKRISGRNASERVLMKAVKEDIAIYAGHTNFDSVYGGVSHYMADRLGLQNTHILDPARDMLSKLVVFVPADHAQRVREAMFSAGAGHIGEYDSCSFNTEGTGTFRGSDNSHPFVGEKGSLHHEPETRVETILSSPVRKKVIEAMIKAHPYEEVAYDIYPLQNHYNRAGMGMIGALKERMNESQFMALVKDRFQATCLRHSRRLGKDIKKVAVCGGAGSFLLRKAIAAGADAFISGDFKYHQFFDAEDRLVILDIGHYESEQFTQNLFYDLLTKKFPKFAVHLSDVNTNPIKYF